MVNIEEGEGVRSILNSRGKIIGHVLEGATVEAIEVQSARNFSLERFYLIKGTTGKDAVMLYRDDV